MVLWLNGKKQGFQGLKSFTKLDYFIDSQNSIRFDNLENPFEEIKNQLANRSFDHATTRYIAVYISPFTKHETDPAKRLELLLQAEEIIMSELPVMPIYYYTNLYVVKDYVKGMAPDALGNINLKFVEIEK